MTFTWGGGGWAIASADDDNNESEIFEGILSQSKCPRFNEIIIEEEEILITLGEIQFFTHTLIFYFITNPCILLNKQQPRERRLPQTGALNVGGSVPCSQGHLTAVLKLSWYLSARLPIFGLQQWLEPRTRCSDPTLHTELPTFLFSF